MSEWKKYKFDDVAEIIGGVCLRLLCRRTVLQFLPGGDDAGI